MISHTFSASTGRYSSKLKEKMTLISKFTNEYGSSFSAAVNYGLGGCSISNIESIKLKFKIK